MKSCDNCPYIIGNDPYYCELSDQLVDPESVISCCLNPVEEKNE